LEQTPLSKSRLAESKMPMQDKWQLCFTKKCRRGHSKIFQKLHGTPFFQSERRFPWTPQGVQTHKKLVRSDAKNAEVLKWHFPSVFSRILMIQTQK